MEFLLVRLIEIRNRQDITDDEGKIIGMEARFDFLEGRNVIIGGRIKGQINQAIELEKGTHSTRLATPKDYVPQNMKIVLENTTSLSPREVYFEKI